MECTCGSEEKFRKRYLSLRRKYEHVRKHQKKLLGVAVELTQVLEEYVRGDRIPNVTETLVLCANIYPSLFQELNGRAKDIELEDQANKGDRAAVDENLEVEGPQLPATQQISEEPVPDNDLKEGNEYSEGFMSRPKLPRTPQNVANAME